MNREPASGSAIVTGPASRSTRNDESRRAPVLRGEAPGVAEDREEEEDADVSQVAIADESDGPIPQSGYSGGLDASSIARRIRFVAVVS